MMKILLLILIICCTLNTWAQLPTYKFTNTVQIKKPLTKADFLKKMQLPSLARPSLATAAFDNQKLFQATTAYCSCVQNPLAVNSITLEAERLSPETVKLNWKTTGEQNSQGFEIERSTDSKIAFAKIGFATKANNQAGENSYEYVDNANNEPVSYYRIKEMDINGTSTYSKIVAVSGDLENGLVKLSPNPADNTIQLSLVATKDFEGRVGIFSASGKQVFQQKLNFSKGKNNIPIDVSTYAKGIYFMNLSGEKTTTLKFVKN